MDLKQECEKTFYRELYHFDGRAQSLVIDETTGKVYLRKVAEVYDERVYAYLRDNRHPHVAAVHSFWREDDKLIVLEENIDGETLDAVLERGELPEADAMRILEGLCDGLQFLHNAQPPVIHRDLKATNVMLTKDGVVKIIDYDAARVDDATAGQERDTVLMGTTGSAAPEQYGFAPSDARTDIYGLGVLMKRLFPNQPQIRPVIEKATKMDPKDRYANVTELLKAAKRAAGDGKTKGGLRAAIAVGLVAALLIVAAVFTFRQSATQKQTSREADANAATDATASDDAVTDHTQGGDKDRAEGEDATDAGSGEAENHPDQWTQARPLTSKRVATLGGLRFEIPKSWTQNGAYCYAETGTGTTMLMTFLNDQVQFVDENEFQQLSGEIAEALTLGMAQDSDMQISERKNDQITVNGIDMVRSVFSATMGAVPLDGELEIIYDAYSHGAAVLYFLQSEYAGKDFFEDYHKILSSVQRITVLATDWTQPAADRATDPFATVSGYHIAQIADDTITINWYDETLGVKALFWKGTYEAPPADAVSFTWTSYADEEEMKNSSLAPDDKTLTFTYENGVLRYEATVNGETNALRLVPVE